MQAADMAPVAIRVPTGSTKVTAGTAAALENNDLRARRSLTKFDRQR
jgi:hypothetical protein